MTDLKEPITTQEQLDEVLKERIKREGQKYKDYVSPDEVEKLKAEHEKQMKESNAKHDKDIEERDAKIKGYETDSVKARIAHEVGLPYGMAKRLSGESEDDIRKDAQSLYETISQNGPGAPLADTEVPVSKTDATNAALKGMLQKMTGE